MNEIEILKDVSRKLDSLDIEYMLTGSLAMNYYSEPRMTRDIDIVVSVKKEDTQEIVSIFKNDYYVSAPAILEAINKHSMFNIIHNGSVIKVDLIIRKDEEYRKVEFQRRQKIKIVDFDTYIVSKEDLIISKLIWAKESQSELQHRDIRNLPMNDTNSGVSKQYREMLMKLSPEERFIRGALMFDAARTVTISSFDKNLSDQDFKRKLFLRFYQNDFNKTELENITSRF